MEWKFVRLRVPDQEKRDRTRKKFNHLEVNLLMELKCMSRDGNFADLKYSSLN